MFIEFHNRLLSVLPSALASLNVPESVITEALKELEQGLPLIDPSPEDNEDSVRPSIGSFLSVRVASLLRRHGFDTILPYQVADALLSKMKADTDFKITLGNGVFLNGVPSLGYSKEFVKSCVSGSIPELEMKGPKGSDSILQLLMPRIESRPDWSEFSALFKNGNFTSFQKTILALTIIVDPEFDSECLLKSPYLAQDNPLAMWSFFKERTEPVKASDTDDSSELALNPYRKPISNNLLEKVLSEGQRLVLEYRYLQLQVSLRSRPELLWKRIMSFNRSVRSLWNDPWGKLALEGKLYTTHRESAQELRDIIGWVVRSWEGFLS